MAGFFGASDHDVTLGILQPAVREEDGINAVAEEAVSLRRINQAIRLICKGARESAFRNMKSIAECLADEIINCSKGPGSNSIAARTRGITDGYYQFGSAYGSYARNSVILGLGKLLPGLDNGGVFSGSYRVFAKDAGAGNGTLDSCLFWRKVDLY